MGDFFKSTRFRILAALLVIVFFFMLRAAASGTAMPMLSQVAGMLLTPVQRAASQATEGARGALTAFFSAPRISEENERLRAELAQAREQLIDFGRYKTENEQLREYLEIKDRNPDFDFEPAIVIGRDAADRFYSFTIDKGETSGVSPGDPVITSEGLVGLVSEVGLTHSKVVTILDATLEVGAMDVATRETGVTSGTIELSREGKLRLNYLPRDSAAAKGDLVATTGIGGLYPADLVLGVVEEVVPDGQGLSLYAVVQPPADLRSVHDVLVIKHFEGQAPAQ